LAADVRIASPLPETFWRKAQPIPVEAPDLIARNDALAEQLGLGAGIFDNPEIVSALAGNGQWPDQQPVSLAYSGHQFGNWNPLMGDGRAHLIATLDGGWELHLKGSGATPFSRNGDGRAALGPMLREYIVSEAFAGLGIPTTRSLSVVATGEKVYRRRKEPGGVLARVAKSHVRVGTFQFARAHLGDDGVRVLFDHERARSYPQIEDAQSFFANVISRQAKLVAQWMCVGFIHGVMNTDNMAISGETIDFGPCAFMDQFHPQKVFSSIDEYGRYAWDQQPAIAFWNLTRLAECLLGLFDHDSEKSIVIAKKELEAFHPQFEEHFERGMLAKLGISERREDDGPFIADMLRMLMDEKLDYTLFFREATRGSWLSAAVEKIWKSRLGTASADVEMMRRSNPIYIARNHQVEAALREAETGHLTRFNTLVSLLRTPFTEQENMAGFEAAPLEDEEVKMTFCGT
jgi:serine/tyrosine/threonine adenylyltransferase